MHFVKPENNIDSVFIICMYKIKTARDTSYT